MPIKQKNITKAFFFVKIKKTSKHFQQFQTKAEETLVLEVTKSRESFSIYITLQIENSGLMLGSENFFLILQTQVTILDNPNSFKRETFLLRRYEKNCGKFKTEDL